MYIEGVEQWIKMTRNFSTPFTEFNKATTEISKRISEQNLEIIGDNFSRLSNQLKRFSNIKNPEDLINLQKDCVSENITACIETAQKMTHLTMENMEEIAELWSSTAVKISEKTVEKAQKFAEKKI